MLSIIIFNKMILLLGLDCRIVICFIRNALFFILARCRLCVRITIGSMKAHFFNSLFDCIFIDGFARILIFSSTMNFLLVCGLLGDVLTLGSYSLTDFILTI